MTQVKICGITNEADARFCVEAGAHLLGFNFYKPSPRYITPDDAQAICTRLRAALGAACPVLVGVFVNATVGDVSIITNKVGLDFAQLSGDESRETLQELRGIAYKAIRPPSEDIALDDVRYFRQTFPSDERAPMLLLDAHHPQLYGGTGDLASISVARAVRRQVERLMLAGGLKPENVQGRVQTIRPWGVDVASGVESGDPRRKDPDKVRAFVQAVRAADRQSEDWTEEIKDHHDEALRLRVEFIGGMAPVQGWGQLDGRQWFFQARQDRWLFNVAAPGVVEPSDLPCGHPDNPDYCVEGDYGDEGHFDASFMPVERVLKIVKAQARTFLDTLKT